MAKSSISEIVNVTIDWSGIEDALVERSMASIAPDPPQRPASLACVHSMVRAALDRLPETRGIAFTVEPGEEQAPSPYVRATADGWTGQISTGTYSALHLTALSFAGVVRNRLGRARRQAQIESAPCCVCLVALGGRCRACKERDAVPSLPGVVAGFDSGNGEVVTFDTEQRPIEANHMSVGKDRGVGRMSENERIAHDLAAALSADGAAVEQRGGTVTVRFRFPEPPRIATGKYLDEIAQQGAAGLQALENAAESLGAQARTPLPEGWTWNPAYQCCAEGPGDWALVNAGGPTGRTGEIGYGKSNPPPDVLAALVTEACRLGIPVKWEPQPGDVVVLTQDAAEGPKEHVGRVGRMDRVVPETLGPDQATCGIINFGMDRRIYWRLDCLRPATEAEAARA